jgi:hypothetical protein
MSLRPGSPRPRSTPLKRTGPIARKSRIKAKKRKPSEFARIYGSKERVAWVKAQPCVVCGRGPCENAHTEVGGIGYKAGYETIVPLCFQTTTRRVGGITFESIGCHRALHNMGRLSFQFFNRVDLSTLAAETHTRWLAYLQENAA